MTGLSLYAADGNYDGPLMLSAMNSSIKVVRVSKAKISDYESVLNKPGVYFLLIDEGTIYVGQSGLDSVFRRSKNVHTGNIDSSWHTLVGFTFDEPAMSSNMLLFLENGMCEYVHKNFPCCATSQPAKDKCTKQYRNKHYNLDIQGIHKCEKFLGEMKAYIDCFPKGLFPKDKSYLINEQKNEEHQETEPAGEHLFYIKKGEADATGRWGDEGMVVLKNSEIRHEETAKCSDFIKKKRKELMEAGIIQNYKFTRDYTFKSPSGAAIVILGCSSDGWNEWKDKANVPLLALKGK